MRHQDNQDNPKLCRRGDNGKYITLYSPLSTEEVLGYFREDFSSVSAGITHLENYLDFLGHNEVILTLSNLEGFTLMGRFKL